MISLADAESIAEGLMREHEVNAPFTVLHDRIATFDDAYAVKDAYVAKLREKEFADICGYKIGLTALKLQKMMHIDEPTEGEVLSTRIRTSPFKAKLSDYGRLGIESEICIFLGRDL